MEGDRAGARRRATASQRRAGRARAAQRAARTSARALAAAIPAIAFALLDRRPRQAGSSSPASRVLACICLHELFAMYAFTNPSRLAGFTGAIALLVAAHLGDQATRAGRLRGLRAAGSSCCACCSRATPARPGWR